MNEHTALQLTYLEDNSDDLSVSSRLRLAKEIFSNNNSNTNFSLSDQDINYMEMFELLDLTEKVLQFAALLTSTTLEYVEKITPTGSAFICNPPVTDTDIDFLVLIKHENLGEMDQSLLDDDWEKCGVGYDMTTFRSYKKKIDGVLYNIIMVEVQWVYDAYVYATKIAKELNLKVKQDRIDLFDIIFRVYPR